MLGSDAGVGPHRHPHRLDDRREHRHPDRAHRAHLAAAQPRSRRRSRPTARCASSIRAASTAVRPASGSRPIPTTSACSTPSGPRSTSSVQTHPGAYTGAVPGRDETRDVISEILGLKIDHTVVVDLAGFAQLIDAMGGIDVNVKLSGFGTSCPSAAQRRQRPHRRVSPATSPRASSTSAATTPCGTPAPVPPTATPSARRASAVSCRRSSSRSTPARWSRSIPRSHGSLKDNIYTDIPAQNLPAFVDLIERVQKGADHERRPDPDRRTTTRCTPTTTPSARSSRRPSRPRSRGHARRRRRPRPSPARRRRSRPPRARRRPPTSSADRPLTPTRGIPRRSTRPARLQDKRRPPGRNRGAFAQTTVR